MKKGKKTVLNFANEIHTQNDAILSNVRIKVKQIFFAVLCVCVWFFFLVCTEIRNLFSCVTAYRVSVRLSFQREFRASLLLRAIGFRGYLLIRCCSFFLLQHLLCVIIWVVLLNIYARYCCGCLFSAFHISYQCKECT